MKTKSRIFVAIIAMFICCDFEVAQAASFDCRNASSQAENLICADKNLSALDSSLGELYSSLKQSNPRLVNEQKQWLLKKRDACQSNACLKAAYSYRINLLKKIDKCPVAENALLGSWVEYKGNGSFEEMEFFISDGKKQFTSWRHHHLEIIGSWTIEQCTIHAKHNTEEALQYSMKIQKLKKGRLYLFDKDSQSDVVYKFVQKK